MYLSPVSQLSHLDITNTKVDSQVRCHLKDISKLNTNVQKNFINSSSINVSIGISVIVNVTIILQIKVYGYPYTLYIFQGKLYFLTNCPSTPLSQFIFNFDFTVIMRFYVCTFHLIKKKLGNYCEMSFAHIKYYYSRAIINV